MFILGLFFDSFIRPYYEALNDRISVNNKGESMWQAVGNDRDFVLQGGAHRLHVLHVRTVTTSVGFSCTEIESTVFICSKMATWVSVMTSGLDQCFGSRSGHWVLVSTPSTSQHSEYQHTDCQSAFRVSVSTPSISQHTEYQSAH